jgi:hypothetical protein
MLEEDIRKIAKNALGNMNNIITEDLNLKLKHIEKLQRIANLSDKEYENEVVNNEAKMLDIHRDLIKALSFYIKIKKGEILNKNKKK